MKDDHDNARKKRVFSKWLVVRGRSCFPPTNFARASNKLNTCFARAPVR